MIEDDPEEIPHGLPCLAAKDYIRAGVIDEEGEVEGFNDEAEEEDIIKLLECTIEAENRFMVSFCAFPHLVTELPSFILSDFFLSELA